MLHNSSKHFLFLCQWMCFVASVWQQLCKNAREQLFCWKDVTHYRIRKYIDLTGVAHTIFAKRGARLVEHTIHFAMNETRLERKETSSRKVWQAKTTCGKWVAIAFFWFTIERRRRRGTGKFQDPSAPLQSNNIKFEAHQHLPLVEHI